MAWYLYDYYVTVTKTDAGNVLKLVEITHGEIPSDCDEYQRISRYQAIKLQREYVDLGKQIRNPRPPKNHDIFWMLFGYYARQTSKGINKFLKSSYR